MRGTYSTPPQTGMCQPTRIIPALLLTLLTLVLAIVLGGCNPPKPFTGHPVQPNTTRGQWQVLSAHEITAIYGIGLSYAEHIVETGSSWNPDSPPPVFRKSLDSLNSGQTIIYPDRAAFLTMAETVEPGLARVLDRRFPYINPLLDYEVEMGIVLLEPFDRSRQQDPAYLPRLGFVLAADVTARSFMVLGENQPNKSEYWGAAKSFSGFTIVGSKMWIPDSFSDDRVINVSLETWVNGQQRQNGSTSDRVYSTRQILGFIANKYPADPMRAGTVIMTGTPPGVAFHVPGWKRALVRMLDFDRFTVLGMVIEGNDDNPDFLMPGDIVGFNFGEYDSVTFRVVGQSAVQETTSPKTGD